MAAALPPLGQCPPPSPAPNPEILVPLRTQLGPLGLGMIARCRLPRFSYDVQLHQISLSADQAITQQLNTEAQADGVRQSWLSAAAYTFQRLIGRLTL